MYSGAPTTRLSPVSKVQPLHLVSGEKGMRLVQLRLVSPENSSAMASAVALSGSPRPYMAVSMSWSRSGESAVKGMRFSTSILGSVMVPVLSTHSTSTRARASMQFQSWTSTRFRLSFWVETARATLVSRYSPSGIMPVRAATVPSALSRRPRERTRYSW